ncbi:MAG: hypothetical protein EOP55_22925 [Sphingobacteriales bacterium]|nr:MAG: hypothetical protein EOP55_22925 [Sphingobacteriales bacterium]
MNSTHIHYSNLLALSTTDYTLANGGTDITGWPVENESGVSIGKVIDMLFDPIQNTIRYLIIDLDIELLGEEKMVLIPIGIAELSENSTAVILPDIHLAQFEAMPRYISGEVSEEMEDKIRVIIGSPAALRMEEEIVELDRENFYKHHHFDRGNLARETQVRSDAPERLPIDPSEIP